MSNVSDRKLFKRVAARNKLREIGGIMASSPELMGTVQKFRDGSGPMGVQPGMRFSADLGQSYGPRINPRASLGAAEVARQRELERLRRLQVGATADPATLSPGIGGGEFARIGDIDTFDQSNPYGPTYELLASTNSIPRNRQTSQQRVLPEPSEGAYSTTESQVRKKISDVTTTDAAFDQGQQQVNPPNVADLVPYDLNNLDRYGAEELKQAGDNARQELITFLQNPNADPALKQDVILEFAGLKQEDEQLSFEERAKSSAEVFKRLFGRDPEKEQTVDGFNTAMLGFLIAAGDSPNALTNIARGAAQGTKNFMDTARRRQDREDKFKMAGIEKVMRDDESRKKLIMDTRRMLMGYRFQTLNNEIKSLENREALALRFNFESAKIGSQLNTQLEIAKDQNLSAEARAAASQQATMLSSLIKSAGVWGVYALGQAGENPTVESFGQALENAANNPEAMAKIKELAEITGKSDALKEMTATRKRAEMLTKAGVAEGIRSDAEELLTETGVTSNQTIGQRDEMGRLIRYYRSNELPLPPPTITRNDGTTVRLIGLDENNKPRYTDDPVPPNQRSSK